MNSLGKLIVIDGGDGAGKATQTALLIDYLNQHAQPAQSIGFPQYETFYGKLIGRYLNGEFGNLYQVSPYLISLAYAADRQLAQAKMTTLLNQGITIVSDRYIPASMAYQGAKIENDQQIHQFIEWIEELEYTQYLMPKENVVIYLEVNPHVALQQTKKKLKRDYLQNSTLDMHEKDDKYRQKVENIYSYLNKKYQHWVAIDCHEGTESILPPHNIHQKIVHVLQQKSIII